MTYERGYERELRSFKTEKERQELAGYENHVKIRVATLIASGEDSNYIANILGLDQNVVVQWYRDLILNTEDLHFREDELSFYREMNMLRADARTIGCIVKSIIEETNTIESAMEIVGVSKQTINKWIQTYTRDYEVMITLPPGVMYTIKPAYVYGLEAKTEEQERILSHDRIENRHAAQKRQTYLQEREL